jgi:hypothetical protein
VRAVGRILLAALLLSGPAAGGDLVRYRAADGTIGLVDHRSKVPPGATVLDVSKPTERVPASEAPPAPPAPRPRPSLAASAEESAADAGLWCGRGRDAEDRIERAEANLAQIADWYDRCDDTQLYNWCSRSSLDAAEVEVQNAEDALTELEDDCRRSGCNPGWLRCAP